MPEHKSLNQKTFKWNFREIAQGEPERLPRELEFFVGGDLDIPSSLVREIIQNSLDAHQKTPVRVRFAFVSQKISDVFPFYEGLLDHLRACKLPDAMVTKDNSLRLLVAEDFNTLGLTGSVRRDEIKEDSISNYYNFWWREGIAQKSGGKGGRWGLGKITFYAASKFQSIWGLTVRYDDKKTLLLGKCLLRPHRYNGKLFDCYGYFSDGEYRSIEDTRILEDFCRRFGITRQAEPGLSIVIPMITEEVNPETIIRSAIMYYFLPIIRGELLVEIQTDDGPPIRIDTSNLRKITRAQSWEVTPWHNQNIDSFMDFIESVRYLEINGGVVPFPVPEENPKISESIFGESLEKLRSEFRGGSLIAFRIPVRVRSADGSAKDSFFNVFMKKDERLEESDEFYWRSGILIPTIKTLGRQRVRALLSANDDSLCGFLGDSETPAHTDWNERTAGFKKKYQNAVATLRFIKGSIRDIVRILDIPSAGRETDFLKEIFYVREPVEEPGTKGVKPPHPKPPTKPRFFDVSVVSGGFCLYLANTKVDLPLETEVTVAYDIRRGNPFKNYSPWDFDLSGMKRSISGGRVISVFSNKMTIGVEKQNFKLEVKGFDPKRDIIIRTSPRK